MTTGALPAVAAGALVFGMVGALWPNVRKSLAGESQTEESQWAGLSTAFFVALGVFMIVAGLVADYTSSRWMLVIGSLLTAFALFGLAASHTFERSLALAIGTAAGTAFIGCAALMLMPAAFFNGSVTASLNMGFVFVALGSLATGSIAPLLLQALGFQRGLGVLSVLSLAPAALGLLGNPSAFDPLVEGGSVLSVLGDPVIWVAAFGVLFYILVEGSVLSWFSEHLPAFETSGANGKLLSLGFWAAYVLGRLLIALMLYYWIPGHFGSWILGLLVILVSVLLGNMVGSQNRMSVKWGVFGLGLALGPILPTLLGLLIGEYGNSQRGTAVGMVFAVGTLGSLFAVPLVASYGRGQPARKALRVPLAASLVLTAIGVVFVLLLSSPLF